MINTNALRLALLRALMMLLTITAGSSVANAQGWETWILNGGSINDIVDLLPVLEGEEESLSIYRNSGNGGYLAFGRITEFVGYDPVMRPEDQGLTVAYDPVMGAKNNFHTIYVLTNRLDDDLATQDMYLMRYDRDADNNLNLTWYVPLYVATPDYVTGTSMIITEDDHLVALGRLEDDESGAGDADLVLVKSDADGNVVWSNVLVATGDDDAVEVLTAADGGYWLLKNHTAPDATVTTQLVKTDEFGEVVAETILAGTENDDARRMIATADGGFAITGQTAEETAYVLKIDAAGTVLWRQDYTSDQYISQGNGLLEDPEEHLVVAGNLTYLTDNTTNACLFKLRPDGTPLWERDYPRTGNATGFVNDVYNDLISAPGGGYIMGGIRRNEIGTRHGLTVKVDTFGIKKGGNISGNVFQDFDLDCAASPEDTSLAGWLVRAENADRTYVSRTDETGNYNLPVRVLNGTTAEYTVSVIAPSAYWGTCANDVTVVLSYLEAVEVDFAMQALVECPFVETQITGFGNIRLCEITPLDIQYCNWGTAVAEDTYVEVTIPAELEVTDFSITPTQIVDNVYTFELGELPIGTCGDFRIYVTTECDETLLGESLCVETQSYPNEICEIPGQAWSGALLQARYTCEDDNLQFVIENVGTGSMASELQYVIIEDAVLLMEGVFDLDPEQEVLPDFVPQSGTTYTLIAQQEPGAPGAELLSIGASDCSDGSTIVLNEFTQYGGNPFVSTQCLEVVGAYDPNDKQAVPSGFGEDHGIPANTPINYTIRFQNTGTDTAFRVVIRDTLSPFLDAATLRPGTASHPYEWQIEDRTLVFRFPNIELPDSNANVAASQGYINFRVDQVGELPAETRIENQAGIYFDFNSPIITNTVFHTVKDFIDIVSGTVSVAEPEWSVSISPNPMFETARIRLEGLPSGRSDLFLQLFDATGREVHRSSGDDQGFLVRRGSLPTGLYVFTISDAEGGLASGKLVIQ